MISLNNDYIDKKIEEAEKQTENTDERYSKEEFIEKMNSIINKYENIINKK